MHYAAADRAKALVTCIIIIYSILTEKVHAMQSFYNVFAVLGLHAFAIVFWFASVIPLMVLGWYIVPSLVTLQL
jgi:hypothetical protein